MLFFNKRYIFWNSSCRKNARHADIEVYFFAVRNTCQVSQSESEQNARSIEAGPYSVNARIAVIIRVISRLIEQIGQQWNIKTSG